MARAQKYAMYMVTGSILFLSSCSPPPIEFKTNSKSGVILVEMYQDWGIINSQKKAPCINIAQLFSNTANFKDPIWKIEASGNIQCLDLASFVVGKTPKGFKQVIALPTNIKGPHRLVVYGIGSGEVIVGL
jgi:hypothetical protein